MAFFTPRVALAVLAMALTTACFDAPKPNCAFYCGTGAEACPDGYTCGTEDGRCHLVLSGGALAQCEDQVPSPFPDAAPVDAGSDAAISTHTGSISISELSLAGAPTLGTGLSVSIDLTPVDPVPAAFDDAPGLPTGCKVHVYDKSATPATQPPMVDRDHGTVKITGTGTPVPDCKFNAVSKVYECPAGGGLGASITKGPMGTAVYAATGFTFTTENTDHYLEISGATPATNNGRFPIVSVDGATATYLNPGAVSDTTGSTFTLLAGQGPTPAGVAEPIANDSPKLMVSIDPAEGGAFDFPDVEVTAGQPFTLDAASQAALTALPYEDDDGFTFACDTSPCPAAAGTIVVITTSDGPLEATPSPFALPPVAAKQVVARCAVLGGTGAVTIPKEVFDLIDASNPTRIRTLVFRAGLAQTRNPDGLNSVNVVAGHAIAGFTTKVCETMADCPLKNDCYLTSACTAGLCQYTYRTAGTVLADSDMTDCTRRQCLEFGGLETVADPADVPLDDGTACTLELCDGQNPVHQPVGAGTMCTDAGGKVCDGEGHCVQCNIGSDCDSGVCGTDHTCKAPTCTDMVENGTETDIDCGGTCPLDCGDGKHCAMDNDCISKVCEGTECQAPSCTDMTENGMETDVDCGGNCPLDCGTNKGCKSDGDCISKVCDAMVCQAPTCSDTTQNQDETDKDCGGMTCPACIDGLMCMAPTDCMSGNCDMGLCAP